MSSGLFENNIKRKREEVVHLDSSEDEKEIVSANPKTNKKKKVTKKYEKHCFYIIVFYFLFSFL
jgi:hypothetical protein